MKIALKEFENIRATYRQSMYTLIHPLIVAVLVVLLPSYAVFRFVPGGNLWKILLIWIILVIGHISRLIIIWRLNYYVVTNQRLLHYFQKGLFDQTVTETPHERILNVSYKTEGIISRFFGYGNVEVQVVGLMEPIILQNIDTPMEIKDYLWELHQRAVEKMSGSVYGKADASHVQEQVGYTKFNKSKF